MPVYSGNIISSGASQGRVEINVWNSSPDANGYVTVWYEYRLWSRYSLTDGTNTLTWSDNTGSGSTSFGFSIGGSGGTVVWRSGSFGYYVGYSGATIRLVATATRFEAFGVNNVSTVDVYYALPARPPAPPSWPGDPYLSAVSPSSATIGWSPSALDNGSPIDGYLLRIYNSWDMNGPYWDHSFQNDTARTVTGLTRGATYVAEVFARNAVGWSNPSNRLTFTCPPVPPSPPGTPQLVAVGATTVELKFTPSTDDGGSGIIVYLLRRFDGSSDNGSYVEVSQNMDLQRIVTGLTPGSVYTFAVYAYNAAGYSVRSGLLTVQTLSGTRVNVAGQWKIVVPYVKVAGVWKNATPYVKVGGVWKISS